MKKIAVLAILSAFVCGQALALTPAEEKEARYQEMKKIKDKQREVREAKKLSPASGEAPKSTFWTREGERSGLGNSGNRAGQFLKNLNPVPFFKDQQEKYNTRKAGGGTK